MKTVTDWKNTKRFSRLFALPLILFVLCSALLLSARGAMMQVPLGGYEGDVSTRTDAGKGSVGVADWALVGRFVSGAETPRVGSEFQRADVAPKDTRGDGQITAADWVQAGRYAMGLDPLVGAGGPTGPINRLPGRNEAARDLRIVNAGIVGNTLNLSIEYEAVGNENAFGFSVNFDPMVLGSPTAALGSGVAGATLLFNNLQAAQGRVGFALALPAPNTVAAGVRQLATLSFTILKVGVTTQLTFGNQPVAIEIVAADATLLPAPNSSTPLDVPLNNPVPTLASISPTNALAGSGAFTLTANGTNFNNSSVVQWNGVARTTTFVSATQITAAITAADVLAAGTATVTVQNPAPGGGTTSGQTFTINNPAPTLTSIDPSPVIAGGAGFTLTVNGTGFNASSVTQVGGSNRATTFVNSTRVTTTVTAADVANAGDVPIRVVNPAPGGGTSNQLLLHVNNPAPTITSLDPASTTTGSAAFTLMVNGTNFVSTSKVRWNGTERTTTFVSATKLTAAIPADDVKNGGIASVTVVTPTPGGGTSNAVSFAINNPTPTITSLDPPMTFNTLPAFVLTVNGTGFVPNSIVRWNGTDRTTTFVSATRLTAQISAADIATDGTAVVTVFNPAPGGGTSNATNFVIEKLTGYEADVSPRPLGNNDGKVTIQDWVQMGRFYVGLDNADNGSEFQRADCAPANTKGDGRISIIDWVQAGRYASGMAAVVIAGGPTQPIPGGGALAVTPTINTVAPAATPRVVRALSATFRRDQVSTLRIELDAQGNENAFAFSLNYDPKLLSFADATAGDGVPGATLRINRSGAGQGSIGVALALPVGQSIAAGTRAVLQIRFLPQAGDGNVTTSISFSDQVVAREMSDAFAQALPPAQYTNATINLSGRAAANVIAASYVGGELAADSIASAFGSNLAMTTESAPTTLPTTLGGTRVRVMDSRGVERAASLFFVSPNQVNYQIPADTAEGIATVTITNRDGVETKGLLTITRVAPGLFSADATGQGFAAANVVYLRNQTQVWESVTRFDANTNRIVGNPIDVSGDPVYLILYGTGIKQRSSLATVRARIDGIETAVEYAGAQGQYVGLDQVNLRLPRSLSGRGEVTVELLVDEKPANLVRVLMR